MPKAPAPPFIGTKNFYPGGNLPVRFIVIHATVSPTKCGGATDIAHYFQHAETSAHYVVDPCQVRQCVHDWDRAWHCGPRGNDHSLGVELCDPQKGSAARWHDDDHEAMLRRAAELVRQLCEAYDVPKRKLTPSQLAAGGKGIVGHADVTRGLGGTTHTDPGDGFPWGHFMALVRGEEDDMPSLEEIARAVWDRPMTDPVTGEKDVPAHRILRRTRADVARCKLDPAEIGKALAAELPAGRIDQATVEAGVTAVMKRMAAAADADE